MYNNMMVALDNSEWSDHAMRVAIDLAQSTGAKLTGTHVYAAGLHDERFRQLEPGLPNQFHEPTKLDRLRGIHGDLIGRGLGIISESYLDVFENRCREAGIAWERKALEGRHHAELVRDAQESRYDLVILGAHGLGKVGRSVLGSVCERVSRRVECDLMVVREAYPIGSGDLLVAIDGSPHSFWALEAALQLDRGRNSPIVAVATYDPFFHGAAFKSIAGVLSEEASKLFRFKEQETLHDEIIDTGLEGIYRSHLEQAREAAGGHGIDLETQLLTGKPFDAIASYMEERQPSLLIVGRVGIHHVEGSNLGSTAENLLRLAPCNVLVVNRGGRQLQNTVPERAASFVDQGVRWDDDVERRLDRVPRLVRGMVRGRIEAFARENGHAIVTAEVYEQARRRFGM